MQIKTLYIILLLLFPFWVVSQTSFSFEEKSIEERLKTDIENLSSPEMEGREAGTPGEEKAARYVATQMKEAGLSPFFDDSYFQEFIFDYEWVYGQQNSLMIRDNNFIVNGDYFVLPWSGNVSVSAPGVYIQYPFQDKNATTESIEERILLMEYYLPDSITSESGYNLEESLKERLDIARKEKAAGVIFVNNHPQKT
ncbi:MAG: hypothetical protein ACOC4J_03840, partial [Bacteroidota bacterium]